MGKRNTPGRGTAFQGTASSEHVPLQAKPTHNPPHRLGCVTRTPAALCCPNIEDLWTWTDQLLADLDVVPASITTTEDHPAIDSRLAHLWAARTGLTNPWHKQRHNRPYAGASHTSIVLLSNKPPCLHANSGNNSARSSTVSWAAKKSWNLLRYLLDPASGKSVAREQLHRVVRAYPGDTPSLMADLAAKYFQLLTPGVHYPLSHLTMGLPTQNSTPTSRKRRKLDRIPTLKHTLYADDVALWVTSGSDGHIEQTLRRAADVVTSHVHVAGLTRSVAKSALLLMRPPDHCHYKTPHPTITVHVNCTYPSFPISACLG
ncbi:hypothetical protein HPB51_015499 [Rhipicephalus microplus]|uniref:Tick transposon n=1 Tax=Rhipicephalus microplus TaxID=6941 RepID=A0A9J6EP95_RHIMP|nr:hypothetical protein HPB51_015499 [Rhipicephalus microplus]